MERRETTLHSFTPSSSSILSHLQPRTSFQSPKVSEWRSKSLAQSSQPEQRGSHARQVDGYSQQRSVSSYRPAPHPPKPAQSPQQPQGRVYQASSAPWDSLSSQNQKKFGTRVVSSGAIEFHAEPKSIQKLSPVTEERFQGSNVPQRHEDGTNSNILPPKKEASSPGVLQTKEIMWNLPQNPSGPSQRHPTRTHSNARPPHRGASSQSSGVLQSKEGMWNIGSPQRPGGVVQSVSKPRSDKYKTPTQRVGSSQSSGVLQTKEGMWNLPQSGFAPSRTTPVHSNTMSSQRNAGSPTSGLQTKETLWNVPQSPSRTTWVQSKTKPSQREASSPSVLQTKEGMWSLPGSNLPNQGINARSFLPVGLERKVQAPTQTQQQPSLSRKPVQTSGKVPSVQTKGPMQQMAAPGHGSGSSITGHATVSYSNSPRGRSSQSALTRDRGESNQRPKGASGMASLTSLYQFDGDRPKLLPSPKRNKA